MQIGQDFFYIQYGKKSWPVLYSNLLYKIGQYWTIWTDSTYSVMVNSIDLCLTLLNTDTATSECLPMRNRYGKKNRLHITAHL